ncbi:MAG TPA: acyl-CoA dehydrogenase family protein, partial [Thermoanaerobaculia bacterium]|nr:acyl-CoA dehydrogenase family protein [Thermoanaerobaculia bacterium]
MDFSIPDRVREIAGTIRSFLDREIVPLERQLFARGFGAVTGELDRLRDEVRRMGLFSPHLPKEWGGGGLTLLEFAHVSEVLGRSPLGHYVFNCQAPDAGNMELLLQHGSDEQREQWLRPLVRGEARSCFGMTEPDFAGSNPVWMGTTARREGDDYVLDGRKWFTSSAEGAAFCVVMAVTSPSGKPHSRASMILVPMDASGFVIVRNLPVMGETGEGWMSHAEVRLEGV